MSEKQSVNGECLCGAVKVKANTASNKLHACHCNMCRKWSGSPALCVDCETDVSFEDETCIKIYSSSDWAERGFCSQCGTHLFYRLKDSGQYIMPAALFNDLKNIEFEGQIFIDEKPDYYEFSNETHNMTGDQVFAMFAESKTSD